MKRISINKLRVFYKKLRGKKQINIFLKLKKFNYLYLSCFLSRDDREFDTCNYSLLKKLRLNKKKLIKSFFKKTKKINGFERYLMNLKEYKYLPHNYLPLNFLKDILKSFLQIFDILGIFLITFLYGLIKFFIKEEKINYCFQNEKIYSIYYWKKKGSLSAEYYYPDLVAQKNQIFISSFCDVKIFSLGLLHSLRNSKFLSPPRVLNLKGLILSLFQFLHLLIYEVYLFSFKKNLSFLTFWIGWSKAPEIFYSILIYNSIIKLAKDSNQCEFISWHENQITNKSFSLGVNYAKRKFFTSNILSCFNGTLFSKQIKKQFLPLKSEFEIGFWGNKYYLQDEGSLKEMKSHCKSENLNISLEVTSIAMQRYETSYEIKKNKSNLKRNITVFTHASYWDLLACLLSIFNDNNSPINSPKNLKDKSKYIYIRLHPALNEKDAREEIRRIAEIPEFVNYEFIQNSKESFTTSIKSSNYCYFGESSYINLAIELKSKVISVETNHLNDPPIKSELINSPNLFYSSPW